MGLSDGRRKMKLQGGFETKVASAVGGAVVACWFAMDFLQEKQNCRPRGSKPHGRRVVSIETVFCNNGVSVRPVLAFPTLHYCTRMTHFTRSAQAGEEQISV